jgi:hypothetical protein
MKAMAVIKCKFDSITTEFGGQRLRCKVLPVSQDQMFTITSQLKNIDFERKMAITQNNIYIWD